MVAPTQGKSLKDVYKDVKKDHAKVECLKTKEEIEKVRIVTLEFYLTLFKFYAEILMALLNNTDRIIRSQVNCGVGGNMMTEDEATSAKEFTIKMLIQKYCFLPIWLTAITSLEKGSFYYAPYGLMSVSASQYRWF